jgi:hypothetical protein
MRKAVLFLCMLLTYGCAMVSYSAPDGTKVTYTRFLTGSDTIKGQLGPSPKIEAQGQKVLDPELLELVIKVLGAVK